MTARTWFMAACAGMFFAACAAAVAVFCGRGGRAPVPAVAQATRPVVAWRVPLAGGANAPCAVSGGGWIVTDGRGGATALSAEGRVVWTRGFTNQTFACAAVGAEGLALLASEDGEVSALRIDSGAPVWRVKLEARFQQPPCVGALSGAAVVWLVSQTDGQLFCLRVGDGKIVWSGEPTNRCDGPASAVGDAVVYGNCDGAVYVFDAATGGRRGAVAVGESDQMAGGVLALDGGRAAVGTRQGLLALVNVATRVCEDRVKISGQEAFLAPVRVFGDRLAMGTQEGVVTFWRIADGRLKACGEQRLKDAVTALAACPCGSRLFALSGGALVRWNAADEPPVRLALGDDVSGLSVRSGGEAACVADGAVVCVREEEP